MAAASGRQFIAISTKVIDQPDAADIGFGRSDTQATQ
jgi:hypothetical protein